MPQLTLVQRAVALTLLETKTQKEVAKRFKVDVSTIKRLKARAKNMAPGELAPRRKPSGGLMNKKLGVGKLRRLKKIVQKRPFSSARQIKTRSPHLFRGVSVRTIQRALKDDLNLPARRAAKKPLLTPQQKEKRLNFARNHLNKSKAWWRSVMFSDESNFKVIRATARQTVRRPSGTRFDPKFTRKTVKHPPGVMVWGCLLYTSPSPRD